MNLGAHAMTEDTKTAAENAAERIWWRRMIDHTKDQAERKLEGMYMSCHVHSDISSIYFHAHDRGHQRSHDYVDIHVLLRSIIHILETHAGPFLRNTSRAISSVSML
jgi:hypothetical protein